MNIVESIQEPIVLGTIIAPDNYLGDLLPLIMVQQHGVVNGVTSYVTIV